MNNIFTPLQGVLAILFYGLLMLLVGILSCIRRKQDQDEFLLAGRGVGLISGAMSSAASWIWAPALFVGSQKAYEHGIAGVFSFCFPNFFALIVFSFVALKARKIFPNGFTLPQLMKKKHGRKVHLLYLFQFIGLQICSFSIQILAGSSLISLFTGISTFYIGSSLVLIALSYSILGGLRASIFTDIFQMVLILVIIGVTVPAVIYQAGGLSTVISGLGGITGLGKSPFNPWIMYSFGIPAMITLITGPVADQMHWQRAYSLSSNKLVVKTFTLGAVLFILVPVSLSFLGFIAANESISGSWNIISAQMIGPITVANFLPKYMLVLFCVMLLSGLGSTLDSILCAVSSLIAIDIFNQDSSEVGNRKNSILMARIGMFIVGLIGLGMTMIPGVSILHLWFFTTTFRAPSFIPTILTIFGKPINSESIFYAILCAFLTSAPVYVYGVISSNPHLVVLGSLLPLVISFLVCMINKNKYSKESL